MYYDNFLEEDGMKRSGILTIIVIAIIIGASLLYLNMSSNIKNGPHVLGELTVQENTSSLYVSPENASVEAFITMPSAVDIRPNGTGIPLIKKNNYVFLGAGNANLTGSVSFNLNYSFYNLAKEWAAVLRELNSTQEIPIIFEINHWVQNGGNVYIYTSELSHFFDPFTISSSPVVINISNKFNLGRPSVIVPLNSSSLPEGAVSNSVFPPSIQGNFPVWMWLPAESTSLSNVNFPLIIFHNSTTLNYSRYGDFTLSANIGSLTSSMEFTSAQSFSNNTSSINNINNWNFVSSESPTASSPNDYLTGSTIGYPTTTTNSSWNVSYVYIKGVTIQLIKYQLYEEFSSGAKQAYNSWQVQEYMENSTVNGRFTVWHGYLPGQMATVLSWIYQNKTAVYGTVEDGNQVNFTMAQTSLDSWSNNNWMNIVNTSEIGIAGLGIAVAAAAALSTASTLSTAAIFALMTSFLSLTWTVVGLCSSIYMSTRPVTTLYLAYLDSFYNQPVSLSIYLDPMTLTLGDTSFSLTSDYLVI
ncbi:MAG: hypothetical protein QW538_05160 [Thermoplasmatales archaeon]